MHPRTGEIDIRQPRTHNGRLNQTDSRSRRKIYGLRGYNRASNPDEFMGHCAHYSETLNRFGQTAWSRDAQPPASTA